MLLSKIAICKWNPRNKKRLESLGYVYTNMGEEIEVNVNHLSSGSVALVNVRCDYCNKKYQITWRQYYTNHKKTISQKDACDSISCTGKKASESLIQKYGTRNIFEVPEIKQKRINTNLKKFGCENPFMNNDVKQKIKETNLIKYGVECCMQNPNTVKKSQQTCLKKYGVINYGKIYSEQHKKDKSPTWKGGVEYHRVERSTYEYRDWRRKIFERDLYTCQCCKAKNGFGKYIRLEAHHIFDWKNNTKLRYEITNGITLCQNCHTKFHSLYGKKGNSDLQLKEFLNNYIDEKIC